MWRYLNQDNSVESNRLKYNEFDYVKRLTLYNTQNPNLSMIEQRDYRNQPQPHIRNSPLNLKNEAIVKSRRAQNLSVILQDMDLDPLPERVSLKRVVRNKNKTPKI